MITDLLKRRKRPRPPVEHPAVHLIAVGDIVEHATWAEDPSMIIATVVSVPTYPVAYGDVMPDGRENFVHISPRDPRADDSASVLGYLDFVYAVGGVIPVLPQDVHFLTRTEEF